MTRHGSKTWPARVRHASRVLLIGLVWCGAWPAHAQEEGGGLTPSVLIGELDAALKAPGQTGVSSHWRANLDLTFNKWRVHGSQNLPVIAAAVALVRSGTPTAYPADMVAWWDQFLGCQNGTGCSVANPAALVYFKGQELGSYTYEWSVLSSVAAVHWWARANGNANLQSAARLYLRKSWSLAALAASPAPVASYQDNTSAGALVDGTCPGCTHNCRRPLLGAPFLALAGARSNSAYFCADSRRLVFAQAIDWPLTNVPPNLEPGEQTALRATLVAKWAALATPPSADNVYGLSATDRTLFRNHVNNGGASVTLLNILNQGATRFIQPYHIAAWSDGERASWMARNPACAKCGGAAYGAKFTPATQRAEFLYPWLEGQSSGHRRGLAQWLPATSGSPARIEAKNCDLAFGDTCPPPVHGDHYVWFAWRENPTLYHVLLGPDAPATLVP